MSENLRNLMNFLRFVGLILADKGGYGKNKKFKLLKDYLKLKLIHSVSKIFSLKINRLKFFGYEIEIFDINTSVSLIESIFIENEYFFRSKTRSPKVFDLGSNIGLSVLYFKTHFPNSEIISFEADPRTAEVLNKNVRINSLRKVKVLNNAVTNKKEIISFFVDLKGPGSPLMSTNKNRLPKDEILVNSVKLSGYIKEPVDLIKMDIEGSESDVLNDLVDRKKLKYIKQMIIEYHHHIDPNIDNFSHFLGLLESNGFGYQIHASQKPPFTPKTFEDVSIFAYNLAYFQPKK